MMSIQRPVRPSERRLESARNDRDILTGWRRVIAATFVLTLVCGPGNAKAHPGHQHGDEDSTQTVATGNPSEVRIVVRGAYRYIVANGLPDHVTGQFPNRGNPNRIRAQRYQFRVPAEPKAAKTMRSALGQPFGIAINGVPFDPGTAERWNNDPRWHYEAMTGKINLGLDNSNAHVQPTGAYHYHGIPEGLLALQPNHKSQMTLLGYAADGFPIYGPLGHSEADDAESELKTLRSSYRLRHGERSSGPPGQYDGSFAQDFEYVEGLGDLDECNGREGVTPEYPDGTYYYVLTSDFPFIPRSFRGTPDESFERRGPGGRPPRGGRPGPPPGGGRFPPPRF